jgi:hypothetical protein
VEARGWRAELLVQLHRCGAHAQLCRVECPVLSGCLSSIELIEQLMERHDPWVRSIHAISRCVPELPPGGDGCANGHGHMTASRPQMLIAPLCDWQPCSEDTSQNTRLVTIHEGLEVLHGGHQRGEFDDLPRR